MFRVTFLREDLCFDRSRSFDGRWPSGGLLLVTDSFVERKTSTSPQLHHRTSHQSQFPVRKFRFWGGPVAARWLLLHLWSRKTAHIGSTRAPRVIGVAAQGQGRVHLVPAHVRWFQHKQEQKDIERERERETERN